MLLIWISQNEELAEPASRALDRCRATRAFPCSFLQSRLGRSGLLVARGRLALPHRSGRVGSSELLEAPNTAACRNVAEGLDCLLLSCRTRRSKIRRIGFSSQLPANTVSRLITRDRALLAYAAAGHLKAIALLGGGSMTENRKNHLPHRRLGLCRAAAHRRRGARRRASRAPAPRRRNGRACPSPSA